MSYSAHRHTEFISTVVQKYADTPGGLLPLLHEVQAKLGCIPKTTVAPIARGMGISRAEVHGVISFYHDFRTEPGGQTIIQICAAEACQAMGAQRLEQHVKQRLGIDAGNTTADGRYTLERVYCLGNCACSPSIRIADEVHARVDPERFDELLASQQGQSL